MSPTRLYSEIGKLLYAIAASDQHITNPEKQQLHAFIQRYLGNVKQLDQFGTPVSYYLEIEFEFLEEELVSPEDAIQSFVDYIEEHYSAIDLKQIEMIREMAWEIANSFKKINQKENKMIKRMEEAFSHIKNKHIQQLTHHENH